MMDTYLVELFSCQILVNAPFIAYLCFKMFSVFMSRESQKGFSLFSKAQTLKLLSEQLQPLENIPSLTAGGQATHLSDEDIKLSGFDKLSSEELHKFRIYKSPQATGLVEPHGFTIIPPSTVADPSWIIGS